MKRLLIISSLLLAIPVFAACPIDGSSAACSIADAIKFPSTGLDTGFDTNVGDKSPGVLRVPETRQIKRQQINTSAISNRNYEESAKNYSDQTPLRKSRQDRNDFSYNASCQFGVCNQTGTPQLFQQRNE